MNERRYGRFQKADNSRMAPFRDTQNVLAAVGVYIRTRNVYARVNSACSNTESVVPTDELPTVDNTNWATAARWDAQIPLVGRALADIHEIDPTCEMQAISLRHKNKGEYEWSSSAETRELQSGRGEQGSKFHNYSHNAMYVSSVLITTYLPL